jgi:hypothetical protein
VRGRYEGQRMRADFRVGSGGITKILYNAEKLVKTEDDTTKRTANSLSAVTDDIMKE